MSHHDNNTIVPLYLNSKDRININDSTTDYTIKLRKDLRNISSISVSNVGIPRNYTNININNNTLLMTFSTEGIANIELDIAITIENKTYTEENLAIAIQNALDLNTVSNTIGLDWTITYDTDTQFYSINVQYDLGSAITWNISFIYTSLIDVLGIGSGGTTNSLYSVTESDVLIIPVNRKVSLVNNIHLNITSNALTDNINTSYITSLAKSFNIGLSNNLIAFDTIQTLDKHTSQLSLGTETVGDIFFGYAIDISGDGNTIVSGAYADDGYTGSSYTFIKQPTGLDYFQTPVSGKTQTTLSLSANGREGYSIALSSDGYTMIVGSPEDDWILSTGRKQGAAYIYSWTGTQWISRFKITPTIPNIPQDQQLGYRVAIAGDGLTVAASGFVETIVYTKIANNWQINKKFPFSTHPQFNSDGTVLTLYTAGNIEIWKLVASLWVLDQTIVSMFPVLDMSDSGVIIITGGNNSVDVYNDTGTYTLDTGAPLTNASVQFGTSVSVSGDGLTIAIGDPINIPGTVWIYTKPVATWVLHSQLTHTVSSLTDPNIGFSVRLSTDGLTMVTGGPFADSNIGSLWVWKLDTFDDTWKEINTTNPIKPIGYASDVDQGYSSSISVGGKKFITGGPLDNNSLGTVWVYERDQFLWNQEGLKIVPSDISNTISRFGHSVSISHDGTTFAAGAIRDFGGGTSSSDDTGSVWVYRYNTVTSLWEQQGLKIFGSPFMTDHFQGTSVSLNGDGNILAIGAPNSTVSNLGDGDVFIFIWTGIAWVQQGTSLKHTLLSINSSNGWSVSLNETGNTIVIGSPGDNSVSVFNKTGTTWTEYPNLLTGTGQLYGKTVSISPDGTTIAVGAPGNTIGDQGYVDIWVLNNSSIWVLQTSITRSPFGNSVDLSYDGNVLCVGALDDVTKVDITSQTYAYTRNSNGVWTQFDNAIVGERRTNTEDFQGFSSSVEYIDESKENFILIVGGIGFGQFQGGNWSYISNGDFIKYEEYIIPTRSYTIFDLINTINTGFTNPINLDFIFTFNPSTNTVTITTDNTENVSTAYKINNTTTFNMFEFKSTEYATVQNSNEMDFSINNNIIKSIDTSYSDRYINYASTQDQIFRKYKAGYTITSSDTIDIQLRDERDSIIDLYGANWIMIVYATIHN